MIHRTNYLIYDFSASSGKEINEKGRKLKIKLIKKGKNKEILFVNVKKCLIGVYNLSISKNYN